MICRDLKRYVLLMFLLIMSGCSDKPGFVRHKENYSGLGKNRVHVVSHGWHTGFVVPSVKVYEAIPALRQRFGLSPNIEIGWGDKAFYQAKQVTSSLALKAILWPTETVVHAVAVPQGIKEYFSNSEVATLCLNDGELSSLVEFISNSFYKNERGAVEVLEKGIYGDSQFYKGTGDYHMLNTCNEWTAKGLKSVGMDVTPVFMFSADSVMTYIRKVNLAYTKEVEPDTQCSFTLHNTHFVPAEED